MKIIHMADSHLGFSSYSRLDQHGQNRIEEMVYTGFDQAIDKIIRLRPDAVVHAGDVFHHVRPKIKPLFIFKTGLDRLNDAGIPVVVISGNHDAPKSYSLTSPFRLFERMDEVHIAQRYKYERFELGDCSFHCIPFCLEPGDYVEEFRKIEHSNSNGDVLVMHGLVESLKNRRMRSVGEHELSDSLLKRDFNYIALGHFHGQSRIAENAWYSGSVEYFNFGEAQDQKGMLLVDLERGDVKPVEVRQRCMIDHPAVDCTGLSSEEIAEQLMDLCDSDLVKDKMVRIILKNVNRAAYRSIDPLRINRLGASALYLKIRAEFADEQERIERPVDRQRLDVEFARFMEDEAVKDRIPRTIKDEVIDYGSKLMKRAVLSRSAEVLDASK